MVTSQFPPVYLISPQPDTFISGGNLYNKRFLEAIGAVHPVSQLAWTTFKAKPPENAIVILDSIYFMEWIQDGQQLTAKNQLGLLLHYLPFFNTEGSMPPDPPELEKLLRFDFFITPSNFMRDRLTAIGVKPSKILVLPPLIPKVNTAFKRPSQPPAFLIVANLLPVKGILEFLKALKMQHDQHANLPLFQLMIIGNDAMDREYARQCKLLLKEEPLKSRVILQAPVLPEQLSRQMLQNDLLISVAQFESFGMAVWEAVCLGLPVIALNRGNIPHLLHAYDGGMLCTNLNEIISHLCHLTEHPPSLLTLKTNAFADRKRHSWTPQKVAEAFLYFIPSLNC